MSRQFELGALFRWLTVICGVLAGVASVLRGAPPVPLLVSTLILGIPLAAIVSARMGGGLVTRIKSCLLFFSAWLALAAYVALAATAFGRDDQTLADPYFEVETFSRAFCLVFAIPILFLVVGLYRTWMLAIQYAHAGRAN